MDPARLQRALQDSLDRDEHARAREDRPERPFLEWCLEYIQLRGRPFSFDHHAYLRELYEVDHPYIVFQKAAQVGISSRNLFEAFYLADQRAAKILYYLSTDQDAFDFSNDRINIAIDDSPYLKGLVEERERGRDNVGLRHIGRGSIFCRGMFTKRKVKAVDGDVLILDELDEADQENKRFALDRILHSPLQRVRELSQPSIPDYGINESFQQTDQRYWHLKCPACGEWACFELSLEERDGRLIPRHFVEIPDKLKKARWVQPDQRYYRACLACGEPLDMNQGEWVAQYPSQAARRGYQISQLYRDLPMIGYADPADWVMQQLLEARKTMDKARVTISILGLPYAGDRAPVSDQVLDRCEGDEGFRWDGQRCFLGIDQGDDLHLVIGQALSDDRLQIVWLEATDDWRRIPHLLQQFGICCAVGDALPNKQSMKELARAAKIPFYIQYFTGSTLSQGEEGEGDRTVRKVTVDRTESLDETTDALKVGDLVLPSMDRLGGEQLRTYELFRAQCKTLVKDLVESAHGVMRWEYKKRVPNHFGMALNSMRIAHQIYRGVRVDYDLLQTTGVKTVAAQFEEEAKGPAPLAMRRAEEHPLQSPLNGMLAQFGY